MSLPRVVVCGLGPGPAGMVTSATLEAIESGVPRYLRTRHHPSAGVVGTAHDFDGVYEAAATFDEVYATIVEGLVAAAAGHGEVLYAVPGSPAVAESTVERLRTDPRVDVELLPGLSFLDLAWDRLGVDPLDAGVRLVDGHRFATEAAGERGPLLVGQCDTRDVLSEVKLALGELVPGAAPPPGHDVARPGTGTGEGEPEVIVLQRLGLPDEAVTRLRWDDLDREIVPDLLTSVFVPRLVAPVAGELAELDGVIHRLRRECPWDREQTHHSLRRHLLEEAYEVVEALDHLDVEAGEGFDELEEELGDLLIQVFFHATLAAEEGRFELADVARAVREKLVGRHPHVFGDAVADTADDVRASWDRIKQVEKGRAHVMEGIPSALPALLYALKVHRRAASEEVDWRDLLDETSGGDGASGDHGGDDGDDGGSDLGLRLWALVDEAARDGVDPETELRLVAERVRDRYIARDATNP